VSTGDQADGGAGLAAQHATLTDEADRKGWVIVDDLTDAGLSGKSMAGRPGLARALELVVTGEADTLAVAKLDRLSRSLHDFAALMAQAREQGWNLVALDLGIDLSTPAGEFMASVMASAAQWERRIIGQRTREALAVKREQGVRLGRPRGLPPEVVRRIVARRAEGVTLQRIADELRADAVCTAQGGTWSPGTVAAVLNSPAAAEIVSA
jgi:DNA invertase Pin-like site-specific DNA recombinase